ncbi:MAG: ankyrin repeat domain-containing protein [Acidobacteriota bacterium]
MTAKAAVAAWLVWWSGASASEDPTAAFLAAARQGRAAEVKRLLAAAPELVGATTCERETALMLAAMGGHLKTMRVLLDAGAEIDAAGPDGKTAIALAAEQCQVGAARLLLGVGIKVWDHGTADLVLAARSGCASVIREALRAGARPVWPEGDRHTPLEEAVEAGCVPCVSALLERTVPLARDERRKVVAWAAERGDVVLLQRLLALGELSDDGGVAERRALRAAVEASRVRTARQLLVAGADPSGEEVRARRCSRPRSCATTPRWCGCSFRRDSPSTEGTSTA